MNISAMPRTSEGPVSFIPDEEKIRERWTESFIHDLALEQSGCVYSLRLYVKRRVQLSFVYSFVQDLFENPR